MSPAIYDDVIKWKYFPRYWPIVLGIYWSPVNSQHKGQWAEFDAFFDLRLMNDWMNNRKAGIWVAIVPIMTSF